MKLIVGATGNLGGEVARRLVKRGERVRALVRQSSDTNALRELGVELALGDLRDSDSLVAATAGVDTVITTATAVLSGSIEAVDRDGYLALIQAAKRNGIEQFIYTSLPRTLSSSPLVDAKRTVEASLRDSGMTYTVLQPTCFMQSWAGKEIGWDVDRRKGMVYGNGSAPVGWIDLHDVAAYAVESVTNDAARNADVLISSETLTYTAIRQIFEGVTGERFKVMRVPASILALGPHLRWLSAKYCSALSLAADIAGGRVVVDTSRTLRDFAVRPTTVKQYVSDLLQDRHTASHA